MSEFWKFFDHFEVLENTEEYSFVLGNSNITLEWYLENRDLDWNEWYLSSNSNFRIEDFQKHNIEINFYYQLIQILQ